MTLKAVVIGECMVELSFTDPSRAAVSYAGDTFNTAVYLSRRGWSVAYATVIGRGDPFSRGILDRMAAEGLGEHLVVEAPGRLPGLYAIERDAAGERTFHYWRSEAPIRDFAGLADFDALAKAAADADLVYLSGITLAVIGAEGRARLAPILAQARRVAFDLNYRPRLWTGPEAAREAADAVLPACAFVSIGEAEAQALYNDQAAAAVADRAEAGAEVLWRGEDHGVTVFSRAGAARFEAGPTAPPVDTTGAGDAFNAAYLDMRLSGQPVAAAVADARALSAEVVSRMGAIIPRSG